MPLLVQRLCPVSWQSYLLVYIMSVSTGVDNRMVWEGVIPYGDDLGYSRVLYRKPIISSFKAALWRYNGKRDCRWMRLTGATPLSSLMKVGGAWTSFVWRGWYIMAWRRMISPSLEINEPPGYTQEWARRPNTSGVGNGLVGSVPHIERSISGVTVPNDWGDNLMWRGTP
jgi:hypothetical protein